MSDWIVVREVAPWLPPPPYLIRVMDVTPLRDGLCRAGFEVFDVEVYSCVGEKDILLALGDTLGFPDYYGVNWAAFEDCLGDVMRDHARPLAVVMLGADNLVGANMHAFVRTVHLLQQIVVEVERTGVEHFQFEVFFVGDFYFGQDPPC